MSTHRQGYGCQGLNLGPPLFHKHHKGGFPLFLRDAPFTLGERTFSSWNERLVETIEARPWERKYPKPVHEIHNLTTPADLEQQGNLGYFHTTCPVANPSTCPDCGTTVCHLDSLILAVAGVCGNDADDDGQAAATAATKTGCGVFSRDWDHDRADNEAPENVAFRVCNDDDYDYDDEDDFFFGAFKPPPSPPPPPPPHTRQRAALHAAIAGLDTAVHFVEWGGQWNCEPAVPRRLGPPHVGDSRCGKRCAVKHVVIKSDSADLVRGMTEPEGLKKWRADGYVTADGAEIVDRDLWMELEDYVLEVEHAGAFVSFWLVQSADIEDATWLANQGLRLQPGDSEGLRRFG